MSPESVLIVCLLSLLVWKATQVAYALFNCHKNEENSVSCDANAAHDLLVEGAMIQLSKDTLSKSTEITTWREKVISYYFSSLPGSSVAKVRPLTHKDGNIVNVDFNKSA